MSTHQLLNGLSGSLQSSTDWSLLQALEQIQLNVIQALSSLTPQEQTRYLRLQRDALQAMTALEAAQQSLTRDFKAEGLAQLQEKIGGRDPEQFRIYTRYKEKREHGFPWDPKEPMVPVGYVPIPKGRKRARRAHYDFQYIDHLKHMSLWEAACMNYGFLYAVHGKSGFSEVEASYIVGPDNDRSLDVTTFIKVARALDLGGQLRDKSRTAMAPGGPLQQLFLASAKASLQFDLIDAYRNRAITGITLDRYTRLNAAIDGSGAALAFDTLNLNSSVTPIIAVPFVAWDTKIPVPLMLIREASLGVVSYFPFRPKGAFQYHVDTQAAELAFRQQLLESHEKNDLGWFARQLPLVGMSLFNSILEKKEQSVEGMSWLAFKLYEAFPKATSKESLNKIRFNVNIQSGRPITLVQALAAQQIARFQTDLDTLAEQRSEKNWQALKDAVAGIANEVLEMLLTPLPGGVTGMNRVMQLAVMGSLTYSVVQGVNELAKGEASGFALAIADVADLAVSGKLISTAGRVHRQRMRAYMETLGNPRKVTRADGTALLWKADAQPYAHSNQRQVDGIAPNALGIYTHKDKHYAKLRQSELDVLVEVRFDEGQNRYVLRHGKDGYAPPIIFDATLQAWTFDLYNAHTLSNHELLQRMLPDGSSTIPPTNLEHMLRSTATTRATLDRVWRGGTPPLNLIEGVRRLQVAQVIQRIIDQFHLPGQMPAHADSPVFCLLTQLSGWPNDALLHIHDAHGALIETYGKTEQPPPNPHAINLKRRDDGTYTHLTDQGSEPVGDEHLLQLILRQQPQGSNLGKEGQPNAFEDARISAVRQQVAAMAYVESYALFSALYNYWGYEKSDHAVAHTDTRFLPVKASSAVITVTPLLKKLRDLNPPLTAANLALILDEHPLSAREQAAFLAGGTLPVAFVEVINHHRTALRIDAVIDSLYNARDFNVDTDLWAREFAGALIRDTLKRPFVVTDVTLGETFEPSGLDDTTVNLRLHHAGRYRGYDIRNGSEIHVSPAAQSFYLAIASVLHPHERQLLGMSSANDAKGLRKTLGDNMSARRSPEGFVSLVNGSLVPYEHHPPLAPDLKPKANGIFTVEGHDYLPLSGSMFRIIYDKKLFKWRLEHPSKIGVDTPLLEHNGHGAWRLASENPMTWDTHQLFDRLGHENYAFDRKQADQILALTDTPDHVLRQVHCAGHPPPPLLADTCKRFRIEQQIQQFIDALRTDPNTRDARPDLQLLVVSTLPEWPDSHRLQIVAPDNQVRYQYPDTSGPNVETITVTEQSYTEAHWLNVLTASDTLTNALLGELPATSEERLFKLVKKIVEYTEKNTRSLFDSLYRESEHNSPNALRDRFKAQHEGLPNSTVDGMLLHATPRELKQLHEHGKVSLRLDEQARMTAHEVRLNRAFEGLYLDSLINPDSDKIILHLLKTLPGWPADIRVEVRDRHFNGPSIESAGNLGGTTRKVLVKKGAVYHAYDAHGTALAAPVGSGSHLLSAIVQTLSDADRTALGITEPFDLMPLQEQLANLALSRRVEIKSLLDLPHLQPWLQPAMGLDRSFLAYPVWSWLWPFGGNRAPDLLSRVQELFPSFTNDSARRFITQLDLDAPAALIELDRRQAEYRTMDLELTRWSDGPHPAGDAHLAQRRYLANQLRSTWRRDNERTVYVEGAFFVASLTLELDNNELPISAFGPGFTGFEHIGHLSLTGNTFSATSQAFLSRFPALRSLDIDCQLNELPTVITDMTQLISLNLVSNRLRLTAESAERLGSMVNLSHLDLSGNLLGALPDFSRMTQLSFLSLRRVDINEWPRGTTGHPRLSQMYLQENRITHIPEAVFDHPNPNGLNRHTYLHDNPLSAQTQERLTQYLAATGVMIPATSESIVHVDPSERSVGPWLAALPNSQHTLAAELWNGLLNHEGASADDTFRVLADLTQSFDYLEGGKARKELALRVWRLLNAMGSSIELREKIYRNTYVAGTCGDGAMLLFTDMELTNRIHQTLARHGKNRIDRELLGLARQVYYLEQLDQFAERQIATLTAQNRSPDPAEIVLFYRVRLREEFNLPVQADQMLYEVHHYGVVEADVQAARLMLQGLEGSAGLANSYGMRDFWLVYLERRYTEQFETIDKAASDKISRLDKGAAEYVDKLQEVYDVKATERTQLIERLTVEALGTLDQD